MLTHSLNQYQRGMIYKEYNRPSKVSKKYMSEASLLGFTDKTCPTHIADTGIGDNTPFAYDCCDVTAGKITYWAFVQESTGLLLNVWNE